MAARAPTQCLVCGPSQFDWVTNKEGQDLWECRQCQLGIIYPQQAQADVQTQYLSNETSSEDYYSLTEKTDWPTFQKRWRALLQRKPITGSYIDIGCNVGTFLAVGKSLGFSQGQGLEPNPSVGV